MEGDIPCRTRGGGGGRPSNGDDGGPASVGPPVGGLGGGSAPLPESDYPVIDFDDPHGSDPVITGGDGTVIDGGYYSDDPVIIGDDGTVIDGGAVGPYPDPGYGGGDYTDPGYDPCCDGGGGGDYWYDDLFRIEDEEYASLIRRCRQALLYAGSVAMATDPAVQNVFGVRVRSG